MSGAEPSVNALVYKRARFTTRLPTDRLYTPSHCWLLEPEPGLWRVGITAFATRMLGEIVEYQFDVEPGNGVATGEKIGWLEGFKAVSDLHSAAEGEFAGTNTALREDITLLESDPYGQGWLYQVRGRPELDSADARGYATILDAAIDKMLASRQQEESDG